MLHTVLEGEKPRVVLLHGFTQTHRSWEPVVRLLPGGGLALVDLPGHGGSAEVTTGFEETVALLAGIAGLEGVCYAGYSMGARLALGVAAAHPEAARSLVLISGTAGIADERARMKRVVEDAALATRIESIGIEKFIDEWLRRPMFRHMSETMRQDRLTNTAAGLAHGLQALGTGTMPSLWYRLRDLTVPVLLVTGELDSKFTTLAREMAVALPAAEHVVVEDAGHAVHIEKPEVVAGLIEDFLRRHR